MRVDRAYNVHRGSCLREGNENSRFGEQVNDYADLYSSSVSNFGAYSRSATSAPPPPEASRDLRRLLV